MKPRVLFLAPIEDGENADDLASITSQRAGSGIGREPVPLQVIGVRDVPQEGVTHRSIGDGEDLVSDVEQFMPLQTRVAGSVGTQPIDDFRELVVTKDNSTAQSIE